MVVDEKDFDTAVGPKCGIVRRRIGQANLRDIPMLAQRGILTRSAAHGGCPERLCKKESA